MPSLIAPATLDYLLELGSTLALIDVREHGEYNAAHIPRSSSLPRRLLESRLERLVPCKSVQLVVCDDDGQRAALVARTVERMGYERVAVLDGGLNKWASAGLPTEWGMNVPSKDFGERVEVEHHVPTIEAGELQRRLQSGERVVILDTRTPEEYGQYCIPGGRSVPGAELAYRISDIVAQQPDASVVVNCAGRTRSIIGARALQRMGLPNIVSLRNGTSGWVLAGLELEQGADRFELPDPSPNGLAAAQAFARRVASEDGVRFLGFDELRRVMSRAGQDCVYLVDVRTRDEFRSGHIPGFCWFPGGQAVQRCDDLVAVRSATIVFGCDASSVRSAVTASWYRQLGFPNVYAVEGGVATWSAGGQPLETGLPSEPGFGLEEARGEVQAITAQALHDQLRSARPPIVVFVDTSKEFADGHIPPSRWISRSWLELRIGSIAPDRATPLVVSDSSDESAPLAAQTLAELGYTNVAFLSGGVSGWRRAGLALEQGLSGVMSPPNDVVPAGPERTYADMINYLRWEEALGRKYEPAAQSPS